MVKVLGLQASQLLGFFLEIIEDFGHGRLLLREFFFSHNFIFFTDTRNARASGCTLFSNGVLSEANILGTKKYMPNMFASTQVEFSKNDTNLLKNKKQPIRGCFLCFILKKV